jgi:hypothetical protein
MAAGVAPGFTVFVGTLHSTFKIRLVQGALVGDAALRAICADPAALPALEIWALAKVVRSPSIALPAPVVDA